MTANASGAIPSCSENWSVPLIPAYPYPQNVEMSCDGFKKWSRKLKKPPISGSLVRYRCSIKTGRKKTAASATPHRIAMEEKTRDWRLENSPVVGLSGGRVDVRCPSSIVHCPLPVVCRPFSPIHKMRIYPATTGENNTDI